VGLSLGLRAWKRDVGRRVVSAASNARLSISFSQRSAQTASLSSTFSNVSSQQLHYRSEV